MSSTPPLAPRPLGRGADLAPGRLLEGRFEIRERIGDGALGCVYRAYDREAEVEVALKTLRDDLCPTAADQRRFLDVAAQLARLAHPNLVRLFRAGQDSGSLFLAMQLIEGLTLREVITKRKEAVAAHTASLDAPFAGGRADRPDQFAIAEVEPFITQIAAALHDGHQLVPHGDLRPENIVVLPSFVKVTDFGLAALVSQPLFLAASIERGAERYLAPEVRAGGGVSIAGDVYSLTAIVAELLCGEVPAGPGFLLREKRPDLAESLEALIGHGLAADPGARLADPNLLARGVRAHLADQSSLSVASRTRSAMVRQSAVGASSREGVAPAPTSLSALGLASSTTGAHPTSASATSVSRFMSAARPANDGAPGNTPPRAAPGALPPLPPAASGSAPKPIPGAQAPSTSHAAAIPSPGPLDSELGSSSDHTTVFPVEAQARLAETTARPKRPVPLAVWIVIILALVGGATYGAIVYIEGQQQASETQLLADQARERAAIARQREEVRALRETAEKRAINEAELARRKADEAAKAAASDPAKKAEADRLAALAKAKDDERLALEKKRLDAEKREAAEDQKLEKARAKREKKKAKDKATEEARPPAIVAAAPIAAAPIAAAPAEVPPPAEAKPPAQGSPAELVASAAVAAPAPAEEKKPELVASAATTDKKDCPSGMIRLKSGGFRMGSAEDDPMRNFSEKRLARVKTDEYCIDRYEFPNKRGARPHAGVTWNRAKAACEAAGKRLCTEPEWERACKGFGGLRFPYGDDFDGAKCNTETATGEKRGIAPAGSFGGCRSGFGVSDMSGNVAEWTDTPLSAGSRAMIIKGGSSNKPDWAVRCANRGNKPAGSSDPFLGFRCCATPGGGA